MNDQIICMHLCISSPAIWSVCHFPGPALLVSPWRDLRDIITYLFIAVALQGWNE